MRSRRTSRALTTSALLGLGMGVDSIQWFIRKSEPLGLPRFGAFENSLGEWKV